MPQATNPDRGRSVEAGSGTVAEPHARAREARVAGIAGLAFVVLFVAGFALLQTAPTPEAPDDEITSFYGSEGERLLTIFGAYIVPFAGIAFLWFAAAVRTVFLEQPGRRSHILAPVQFASGILFVAASFIAAAIAVASATGIDFFGDSAALEPGILRALPELGYAILFVMGLRMAGVFVATTSGLGRGIMPAWLVAIGYLFAVALLLTVSFTELLVLIFPAWVVILSAWLLLVPGRGRDIYGADG